MKPPCFPFTGHDLLAVERFHDDTRHMLEFQVLSETAPTEAAASMIRLFLSEDGYAQVLDAQRKSRVRVYKHAAVIEGHIMPPKPKKRRRK